MSSPFSRVLWTFWPNINGHGLYIRLSRWPYASWSCNRDIFDRWIWQIDLGTWRVSVGWL